MKKRVYAIFPLLLFGIYSGAQVQFVKHQITPEVYIPRIMDAEDVNNDDIPDIITNIDGTSFLSKGIGIFTSNIDSYAPISELTSNENILHLSYANINGDNSTDIVYLNNNSQLFWLDGTSGQPTVTKLDIDASFGPFAFNISLDISDLNSDNLSDFIISDGTDNLYLYISQGNEAYEEQTLTLPSNVIDVAIGTMHNDGKLNLAVLYSNSNSQVKIFENNGSASFTETQTLNSSESLGFIDIIDLHNDNYKEIIVGKLYTSQTSLSYFINNAGNYGSRTLIDYPGQSDNVYDIKMDFITNSSYPDIIELTWDGIFHYPSQGELSFSSSASTLFEGNSLDFILLDYNNDNLKDIAVSTFTKVLIKSNLDETILNTYVTNSNEITHFAVSDIDEDGDQDIFTSTSNGVDLFLNDQNIANNNFHYHKTVIENHQNISNIAVGDVSKDGRKDIYVFKNNTYSNGLVLYGDDVAQYFKGSNQFDVFTPPITLCDEGEMASVKKVYVTDEDINEDGKNDIHQVFHKVTYAGSNGGSPTYNHYYLVQKSSWDSDECAHSFFPSGYDYVHKDIDNDGTKDFYILRSDGVFLAQEEIISNTNSFNNGFRALEAADLDGDGDMDFIIGAENDLFVYENLGAGLTSTPYTIDDIQSFSSGSVIKAADLNADGFVDIVAPGIVGSQLNVYFNQGNYSFEKMSISFDNTVSNHFEIADIDNNGVNDIVIRSEIKLFWLSLEEITSSDNNHKPKQQISLYPNPTKGNLVIDVRNIEKSAFLFEVFDINGSKVHEYNLPYGSSLFNIEDLGLKAGVYCWKLKNNSSMIETGKIIVLK